MEHDIFMNDNELSNEQAAPYVGVEVQTWNKWRSTERRKPPEERDPTRWCPYRKVGNFILYAKNDLAALKQRQVVS